MMKIRVVHVVVMAALGTSSIAHGAPDSVDWRQKGAVTAVKDNGQCGSHWAFSAIGAIESARFLKTGTLEALSEQQLLDCNGSYGNQGCNGGLMEEAFMYVKDHGVGSEVAYPYTGRDGTCKASAEGVKISEYVTIPSGDEEVLKEAVAQQPVSAAIDASHFSFQSYHGGVYYEQGCSSTQLDHGVLIVGYGSDGGNDYWIVKNSWGADWGNNGYILMARNRNNNCGIATAASYPKM